MAPTNKYWQNVAPRLDEVVEWARNGATNDEIAKALDISHVSFYRYLKDYPDLKSALIEGRHTIVVELKRALLSKALGGTYEETKETIRDDGETVITTTEKHTKHALPSEGAIAMLLRYYDPEYSDRDKKTLDQKEKELVLKERIAESNYFLDNSNCFGQECVEKAQEPEEHNEPAPSNPESGSARKEDKINE